MFNSSLRLITGYIQCITPMQDCFNTLVSVSTINGPVNFIAASYTYIVDNARLSPGMYIGAFYDEMAPTTMQYPPTFQAVAITVLAAQELVMINYFDENLLASDDSLQLNLDSETEIATINGQQFNCYPGEHVLMVYYAMTTRSLPPQTTPSRVIVLE